MFTDDYPSFVLAKHRKIRNHDACMRGGGFVRGGVSFIGCFDPLGMIHAVAKHHGISILVMHLYDWGFVWGGFSPFGYFATLGIFHLGAKHRKIRDHNACLCGDRFVRGGA